MEFVYRGLKAEYEDLAVTPEEIDRQLETLRQQTSATRIIRDRPTQNGDRIVLDFAGFCEGVQFPGGTAEAQTLTLGSGAFVPGFEDQLIGKQPGAEVTVEVTFPEDYPSRELAGKPVRFECKIHEIYENRTYQMDDEFAHEVGNCATLDEMRRIMGETLKRYHDACAEEELQDSLIRQAAATLDFQPTQEALDKTVEQQIESLKGQLAQRNLTLEAYCQFSHKTPEELREELLPDAEQILRTQATIEKIAELEKLAVTDAEMQQAFDEVCAENKTTMDVIHQHYGTDFDDAVRRQILSRKAIKAVRDAAEITVVKK